MTAPAPDDPQTLTALSFYPSQYDYIEQLRLDPEEGALEFCRGGGQRLYYLLRGRYAWRRESEARWRLEIGALDVLDPYTEARRMELPPRSVGCRVERGPFAIRRDVVWRVKSMAAWPCSVYPLRLRFDEHPLFGRALHSELPAGGYEEVAYPSRLGEDREAAAVRASMTTRGLLLLHDRTTGAARPDDAEQPSFVLCPERMGGSILGRMRRQLEGDFFGLALGLRGGEERSVDRAIEVLAEVGVDEVVALTMSPLPEPRPPVVLAQARGALAKRLPGAPLRVLPAAFARERVAHHLARQLRQLGAVPERVSQVLLCASPASAVGAEYVAAARAIADDVAARAGLPCHVAFSRRAGARPTVDEALAAIGLGAPGVALAWISPLAPTRPQVDEALAAAEEFRGAGGTLLQLPQLITEHVAELLVDHARAHL